MGLTLGAEVPCGTGAVLFGLFLWPGFGTTGFINFVGLSLITITSLKSTSQPLTGWDVLFSPYRSLLANASRKRTNTKKAIQIKGEWK